MGAWGVLAFDNDRACDWAAGLADVNDLSLVEAAFAVVERSDADDLDADDACAALAACEVLARLRGQPGYKGAYTQDVDEWAATHRIAPPPSLLTRAEAVIDRVLGDGSELRKLWEGSPAAEWRQAVVDLRRRLRA